ncbi:MAG: glycosyltransferase family 2 protein [Lachnospiraceae bacterium]|nr:glycosyltransferase family 2 protein [Lachnospiraceae bacterium]
MAEKSLITIIIPVYNKEAYLKRCLDSVLSQTYPHLEVLLVDDCSKDGSLKICEDYAKRDARVRVLKQEENAGASAARNAGIEAATGDYIGFTDADDWIEPEMYEALLDAIRKAKPGSHMVQLMSRNYAPDGTLVVPPRREDGRCEVLARDDYFRELIMHEGDSSFCTKLFERDFLQKYRFAEGKKNEDFELLLRMMPDLEAGIPTVGMAGYNIRLSEDSVTRGEYRQELYEDMMYNAFTACRIARDHYPEYLEEGRRFRLVQALDFLLHIPIEEMRRKNAFYMRIVRFVRSEKTEIRKNRYLNKKQRSYLKLLAFSPRGVRSVHRVTMKLRGK